jgi:hypothetical protein
MADFKEILDSIQKSKKYVLDTESDYSPFGVNRVLSYYKDSILYANMMNMKHDLDRSLQYQYLLNTIRPMKRQFQNMKKVDKVLKDIECVKLYFGYSDEKAKEALRILTDEQIALIKEKTEKGGVVK